MFDAFVEDFDAVPSRSLRSATAVSVSTSILDVLSSGYLSIQLRNQVSTSVLDILSIGVSVHTIKESASKDKKILKD